MTRVLIVQHDPAIAEQMAVSLRMAGFEAELCGGPGQDACPVIADMPCPIVDRSDVLVYDDWAAGDAVSGRELVSALRDVYADIPLVLTSVDETADWVEREGLHHVTPLVGEPTRGELIDAVEVALGEQGMAG
jgi:DNA-binding response OmpR family regulator